MSPPHRKHRRKRCRDCGLPTAGHLDRPSWLPILGLSPGDFCKPCWYARLDMGPPRLRYASVALNCPSGISPDQVSHSTRMACRSRDSLSRIDLETLEPYTLRTADPYPEDPYPEETNP